MKKVIIKSIIITLILVLLLVASFSFVLCLFFPKTVSNLSFRIGNYDLAVTYSEKAYEKNQSTENLVDLVEKSIVAKNYKVNGKYAGLLLVDERFINDILPNKQDGYFNYIAISYVKSLYLLSDYQKCVKSAVNYTNFSSNDGNNTNATTTLISLCVEDSNKNVLTMLLGELDLLESNTVIEKYKSNLNTILQN